MRQRSPCLSLSPSSATLVYRLVRLQSLDSDLFQSEFCKEAAFVF